MISSNTLTILGNGIQVSIDDTVPTVETITQEQLDRMVEMLAWCQHGLYEDYQSMEKAYGECSFQRANLEKEKKLKEEKFDICHKEQRKQRFWKHVYMVTSGALGLTLVITSL